MKQMKTSYTHYREDVFVEALFPDIDEGNYLEVDGHHPLHASITKLFYQKGWQGAGIHTDPVKRALFAFDRPNDKHVTGMPSSLKTVAGKLKKLHYAVIDSQAGQALFDVPDWQDYRPEVIVVRSQAAQPLSVLAQNRYELLFRDGLHHYYLAKEASGRRQYLDRALQMLESDAVVPVTVQWQVALTRHEKMVDEIRHRHQHERLAERDKQIQWYENAPLSWVIIKLGASLDRAITRRLIVDPQRSVAFDQTKIIATPKGKISGALLQTIATSYADGVRYEHKNPSAILAPIRAVLLLGYRVIRKITTLLTGKLIDRRRNRQEQHA